jgi:hypothetical protein
MSGRLPLGAVVVVGAVAAVIAMTPRTHSAATRSASVVEFRLPAEPTLNAQTRRTRSLSRLLADDARRMETRLSEQFDAFLEPRISPTPFPAWLAQRLRSAQDAVSPDPRLAVYLAPLAGGWAGWFIPGAHGVCIEAVNDQRRQARGECGSVARADRGMLIPHYPSPGNAIRLFGVAPDTSTHIELRAGDGANRAVTISNNAWTSTVPARTTSVAVLDVADVG